MQHPTIAVDVAKSVFEVAISHRPGKVAARHRLTRKRFAHMRATWVATRTSRLNTLRGLLRELGLMILVGARHVVPRVWALVSDVESGVPELLRPVLAEAAREITELEQRIAEVCRSGT